MLLWNTFIATFMLVFFAELGDKTQLSTMLLAAHNESVISVFLGASLALIANTVIGVYLGTAISRMLPMHYIHIGAGIVFLIIGMLLITQRL